MLLIALAVTMDGNKRRKMVVDDMQIEFEYTACGVCAIIFISRLNKTAYVRQLAFSPRGTHDDLAAVGELFWFIYSAAHS